MPDHIPAMTVTIQVRDGPTVHLDYNPALEPALPLAVRRSLFRPYVACSSVAIANQHRAAIVHRRRHVGYGPIVRL
jgi:hypothetical protein